MYGKIRDSALTLALEIAPAALFAGSVGFAISSAADQGPAIAAATAAAAFFVAWAGLRRFSHVERPLALPPFELDEFPSAEESPVVDSVPWPTPEIRPEEVESDGEELLLEDVLTGIAPDSRVVRLFDAARAPTAGELQARIDRHLHSAVQPVATTDATQELHEALDALRRSLR